MYKAISFPNQDWDCSHGFTLQTLYTEMSMFSAISKFFLSQGNAQIAMKTARWDNQLQHVSRPESQRPEGNLFLPVCLLNVFVGWMQMTHALQLWNLLKLHLNHTNKKVPFVWALNHISFSCNSTLSHHCFHL